MAEITVEEERKRRQYPVPCSDNRRRNLPRRPPPRALDIMQQWHRDGSPEAGSERRLGLTAVAGDGTTVGREMKMTRGNENAGVGRT